MMEVLDVGRLIECIQERTFLWNEKSNHFRDKKARDMAWMEIGVEMYDDWSQLSRSEKVKREKLMKMKWKHMKDSFKRSIRHGQSNSIYAESLDFLEVNYEEYSAKRNKSDCDKNKVQEDGLEANENSSSNSSQNINGLSNTQPSLSQETSDCSTSDSIQNNNGSRNVQPSLSQDTSDSSSSDSEQNTKRPRKVKRTLSPQKSKKVKASPKQIKDAKACPKQVKDAKANPKQARNTNSSTIQVKDPEKMFLDSLLSEYRELDEDDKLDFRIMCLQLIRKSRKRRNMQNHTSPAV